MRSLSLFYIVIVLSILLMIVIVLADKVKGYPSLLVPRNEQTKHDKLK